MFEWYENQLIWITVVIIIIIGFITLQRTKQSAIEARLYNDKYGTLYTTDDFFWSGETIKSMLTGGIQSTQNLNINGSIPVNVINK